MDGNCYIIHSFYQGFRVRSCAAGILESFFIYFETDIKEGYEFEIIRQLSDREKAKIPIIAMTANAFEEDKRKAFSVRMNGHIAKPIDAEKMESAIVSILEANDKEKQ